MIERTPYHTISLDDSGQIARITRNRPDKRNPIGPDRCGELRHALARLRGSDAVRVVVLTGAGTVFSAGGDLSAMAGGGGGARDGVPPASLVELLLDLHDLGRPVIAMVNGHALAGGLGLM